MTHPISPNIRCKLVVQLAILLATFWTLLILAPAPALTNPNFPHYTIIEKNVLFWEKIYSRYSINSVVIHDREDLSRIYDVIPLIDSKVTGADKINRLTIKLAIQSCQKSLLKLAQGKKPVTKREKHIISLFLGTNASQQMTKAANTIRSQRGQKERFLEGVIRSGKYLPEFKTIFLSHNLPIELAYLPHVESSFNTKAYSKFGAAGVWQFTRGTGKQYLKVNSVVDERLDPFLAADAAAIYLKDGFKKLGNWPMAITGYNYGTAGMVRAKQAWGSYPQIFLKYREGHFGFASQNFYSEFLAAMNVAEKLEKNSGITLDSPVQFLTHVLPGHIHIRDIKRHFSLSESRIQQMNPALKTVVYQGKKLIPRGYALRLPNERKIRLAMDTIPDSYYRSHQVRDIVYRVKRGDTASEIAHKHQITLKDLIRTNGLRNNGTIYIGQRLRVPSATPAGATRKMVPYLTAERRKIFPQENTTPLSFQAPVAITVVQEKKKRTLSSSPISITIKEGKKKEMIEVTPQESLLLYSRWLRIPAKQLREMNNLDPYEIIEPGQKVLVPYSRVTAAEFAEQRAAFVRETESDFFARYTVVELLSYRVQPGDTLWDLCNRKFNIPLWLLKKYNSRLDYSQLQTSQQLSIPVVELL